MTLEERIHAKEQHIRALGLNIIALCYGRKSVVHGREDVISTIYQKQICEKYCSKRGWTMEWYADDKKGHQSGFGEKNRPEWARLKAQLARPDVIAVVCENRRAFYRNNKLLLQFVDELDAMDIAFIDASLGVDVFTADGRATLSHIGTSDEAESRRASERGKHHIAMRFELGARRGRLIFGVKSVGKGDQCHWVASTEGVFWFGDQCCVGEESVKKPFAAGTKVEFQSFIGAVKRFYQLYAYDGVKCYAAASILNSEGWRYKGSGGIVRLFDGHTLWRILLQAPLYAGYVIKGRAVAKNKSFRKSSFPPIIADEQLLSDTIRRFEQQGHREWNHKPFEKFPRPLLWRLVYCNECQQRLYHYNDGTYRYYFHRYISPCGQRKKYSHAEPIEQQVIEALQQQDIIGNLESIKQRLNNHPPVAPKPTRRKQNNTARIEKIERELRAMKVPEDVRRETIARLRLEVNIVLTPAQPIAITPPDLETMAARAANIFQTLAGDASAKPAEVNEALLQILDRICVSGEDVIDIVPKEFMREAFSFRY